MEILIKGAIIERKIWRLGKQISKDYAHSKHLVLLCVLKGSIIFCSKLLQSISINNCSVEFIKASSYINTESSGIVNISDIIDLSGKDILIVEDIVDTGLTLEALLNCDSIKNANTIKIASLLSKPSKRKTYIKIDYLGFEIEDKFVIGYGLDYNQRYRNLNNICVLNKEDIDEANEC